MQIVWNEVPSATSYAVFEASKNNIPSGVPITTAPANLGGNSKSLYASFPQ